MCSISIAQYLYPGDITNILVAIRDSMYTKEMLQNI